MVEQGLINFFKLGLGRDWIPGAADEARDLVVVLGDGFEDAV